MQNESVHLKLLGVRVTFILCLFSQLLIFSTSSYPQHRGHYKDPFFGRVHQVWQVKDNLPSGYIKDIIQSKTGFIWLTTTQGLVQYDGLTFTSYNSKSNNELTGEHLTSIIEIEPDKFLIGSAGYGVFLFKDGVFKNFRVGNTVNSNIVNKVCLTKDYGILICTEDGLFQFVNQNIEQIITLPNVNAVRDLKIDSAGNIVLAAYREGVLTFDKNFKLISEKSLLTDDFKDPASVYFDEKSNLWISTFDNLYLVSGRTIKKILTGSQMLKIEKGPNGFIFVTSEDGLISVHQDNHNVSLYKNFSDRRILSTFISKEDIIWVGTYNGLNAYRKSYINSISTDFGLSTNHVRAIYEDRDSNYWIGTFGGGLYKFDNKTRKLKSYLDILNFKDVYSIYEDEKKALWIASSNSFAKLEGNKAEVFSLGNHSNSVITVITKNHMNGDLILATSNGEIFSYNGKEFRKVFETKTYKDIIYSMVFVDSSAYIASSRGLFVASSGYEDLIHYSVNQGLLVNSVRTIYKDNDGIVWVGTSGGGLFKRENGRIYNYSIREGLLSKYIWSIVEDGKNNLWLTSDEGISVINRNDIRLYDEKKIDQIPALMFGQVDGMINPECNTGHNVGFKASNGKIWFASMGGAVIFHPDSLLNSIAPLPVYVKGVKIDAIQYPASQTIEIPAGSENIEVNFSTLSFSNNSHLNFRYRILESTNDWIYINKRLTIYLSNLNPGKYSLIIQADNGQEKWEMSGVELALIQLPKYYQTLWFRTLLVIILGFLIYLLIQYRLKAVNKKNQELIEQINKTIEAEAKLNDAYQYIQYVVDSIETVIISVDDKLNVTHSNKSSDKFKNGSMINSGNIFDVFPNLKFLHSHLQSSVETQNVIVQPKMLITLNSESIFCSLSIFPLRTGTQKGFVILIDDVTERTKLEEVMIQSEKMISVAGLAAGMAHEINNPLGTIVQGCQNILRRVSSSLPKNIEVAESLGINISKLEKYFYDRQIYEIVDSMRFAASKASEIIKNMLQFSRRSESKKIVTTISNLIDNVLDLAYSDYDLKKKYDFRAFQLVKEVEPDLPLLNLTVTEIEQVLFNIIKNAVQALNLEKNLDKKPKLIIRAFKKDNLVRIEIEDNGPGMPDNIKNRIFEPFFTTKEVGEGTGLGLSVSYMIITNNHQGKISVESSIGVGTNFIIELPVSTKGVL